MEVQVNLLGVLGAVVVSMMVGGLWYSKFLFGTTWMKLAKIDKKKAQEGAGLAMAGMAILALVMAFVLAHVTYLSNSFFVEYSFQASAIMSGLWVWLGFVLPVTASDSLFNQKPWKLSMIHAGNWLITLIGMSIVIGIIGV